MYAVEFSHRSGRDLINVAKKRTNVIPVIEDARHPHKYRMLIGEAGRGRRRFGGAGEDFGGSRGGPGEDFEGLQWGLEVWEKVWRSLKVPHGGFWGAFGCCGGSGWVLRWFWGAREEFGVIGKF